MSATYCDICTKRNKCKYCNDINLDIVDMMDKGIYCPDFVEWGQISYYQIDFVDDEDPENTSFILIAINKSIYEDKDLLDLWPQIEPHLFGVWGHVTGWTWYDIDPQEDDAGLATYIFLD